MEIQKIYSDLSGENRLYSVVMNEEELALFSEKKMKGKDKAKIKAYKVLGDKEYLKLRQLALEGKPEKAYQKYLTSKTKKQSDKYQKINDAVVLGLGGSMLGAGIGGMAKGLPGAIAGGIAGGGLGAYGGTKLAKNSIKFNDSNVDRQFREDYRREDKKEARDRLKVALGEMSEKDYIKKWGVEED